MFILQLLRSRWIRFLIIVTISFSISATLVHRSLAVNAGLLSTTVDQSLIASANDDVRIAGSDGRFFGQVVINGSSSTAWSVLTDYNNFASFLPNVESSRTLRRDGDQVVFEQINIIRVAVFTRRNRVVMSVQQQYPREIRFNAIEGDVRSLHGTWTITPKSENQVVISHQVTVDPGESNIRGLFFNIYRNELRTTLIAIKQEIERRSRS